MAILIERFVTDGHIFRRVAKKKQKKTEEEHPEWLTSNSCHLKYINAIRGGILITRY